MLFRECAFWAFFSKRFCSFLASLLEALSLRFPLAASSAVACCIACSRSSSERWAYHTSNVRIFGELGHRLPIRVHRGKGDLLRDGLREAVVVRRHREAGCQPLHVVLEGTGQGLVEVVDVEDETSLRGAEHPEVRQVGITAQLDLQTRRGRAVEVCRHDPSRAPVERERRSHHAAVTHRDEVDVAPGILLADQVHRFPSALPGRPSGVTRRRHPYPGSLAPRSAFLQAQVLGLLQHGPTPSPGSSPVY